MPQAMLFFKGVGFMRCAICLTVAVMIFSVSPLLAGQDDTPKEKPPAEAAEKTGDENKPDDKSTDDQAARFESFKTMLSGVDLVGHFTVVGKEDQAPKEERYSIQSVTKVGEGDVWLFLARIQYGGKDVTLPLPLAVKWAGDTPVITLSKVTIPGLGAFDARVVLHDDKYAGTWRHDKVHGHLFGRIEKSAPAPEAKE
jgi:hypothetical protein